MAFAEMTKNVADSVDLYVNAIVGDGRLNSLESLCSILGITYYFQLQKTILLK